MGKYNYKLIFKNTRISKAYFLLFTTVSTCMLLILGGMWIASEYTEFRTQSKLLKDKYIKKNKDILIRNTKECIDYIEFRNSGVNKQIKIRLTNMVEQSYNIATSIYNKNKNKLSEHEIKIIIKDAISAIHFGQKSRYVFINTLKGYGVLYPTKPNLEGVNLINYKDINNNPVIFNEINALKNKDQAYLHYENTSKDSNNQYTKFTYLKKFKPYNWYFGSYTYVDDLLDEVKAECIQRIASMRVVKDNYFFIYSKDGTCLLHKNPSYINKNYRTFVDEDDKIISRKILYSSSHKDLCFIEYEMPQGTKISYLKEMSEWNWIIGSGFYLAPIKKKIQKEEDLLYSSLVIISFKILLIVIISIIILYLLSIMISNGMSRNLESLNIFFKKAATQSIKIDINNLNYSDFQNMASSINKMIDVRTKKEQELEEAKERAEKSDKLKSAFLSSLTHEIRTPMNAIVGFSELLINNDLSKNIRYEFIDHIINNSNSLLFLINNIIDLSIIETGTMNISNSKFVLAEILKDISIKFEKEKIINNKTNITLMIVESEEYKNFLIDTDKHRLNQIIWNIVDNALKFTKEGVVSINHSISNNTLFISIKDTGIGIDKEKQKFIFDKFRQGDDEKSRRYSGTGIGLSLSKQLVLKLKGEIWIESEIGKGSTFHFSIPIKKT